MKASIHIPRYQQIAVDIAGKIISGDYREGDRIFARSTLALQYNVSAETARRAIALLAELGVLSAVRGSGCTIESVKKAMRFRDQYQGFNSINTLRQTLDAQLDKQAKNLMAIKETTKYLTEQLEHYQHTNPLYPMHIKITMQCRFLGRSIKSLQLWQHTGTTVVALNHQGKFQVSPGPYAHLQAEDELYFVGDEGSWNKLHDFLYGNVT